LKDSVIGFLNEKENYRKAILFSFALDMASTLAVVSRYGIGVEGNPIMKAMIVLPVFPLLYAAVMLILIALPKWGWDRPGRRYLLWLVTMSHFTVGPFFNTVRLLGEIA
jgi:hypothetical protein